MEPLVAPIASGMISAAIAAFGIYVAMTNRLTKLETMIDHMSKTIEKHNSIVERTFLNERDISTQWKRHDELAARVERLERGND